MVEIIRRVSPRVCAVAVGALVVACGMESSLSRGDEIPDTSSGADGGGVGPGPACTSNADCAVGWTCDSGACFPPEDETNRSLSSSPPVATPRYVYALNPTASSVARINPANLEIEAVTIGPEPVALSALPNEDAAVALSYGDGSLSIIDSSSLPSKVIRLPLKRQHMRLTVSPDGRFAVAYPANDQAPTGGAEGIITLIDLAALRQGAPADQVRFERAAGYRITDVVFRMENGVATRLHVFAKSTLSTINLADLTQVLPARINLPESMSSAVSAREVVADPDGLTIVLRSTVTPELAWFDGTALNTVTLPEVATDLDLLPDGTAAVAALRSSASLALLDVPADFTDPSGIEIIEVTGAAVGQVVLPPSLASGTGFALVYTNASNDESFARVDLPSGTVTRYVLEKLVEEVSISPDGASAIIVHRPNASSTAEDPYDRAVDKDEGYSIFDVGTGYSQLKRTGTIRPTRYAFSPLGGYAGVALRDDAAKKFALDAVDLHTLVAVTLPLASAPTFMGMVPQVQGVSPHRVFVSQEHNAGRISVVTLDTQEVRTATGFTLNAEIE